MTWKELFEEYTSGRKVIKKDGLVVLVLLGVLIFVVFLPTNETSHSGSVFLTNKEGADLAEATDKTQMEEELKHFLGTVEGVGKVEVLIYSDNHTSGIYGTGRNDETITGVIVSAEGADSNQTKMVIVQLIKALYGLDYSAIEVFPMKRE